MAKENYVASNIINYIKAIKSKKTNKKGVCLLIGAGADIASGGKTFTQLKYDLLKMNGIDIPFNAPGEQLTEAFDKLINKFTQSGRCSELENVMRDRFSPSEGYELLVLLAEMKYIDAVVTTNFDTVLEETEKRLSLHPFDIYSPGVSIPDTFYSSRNDIRPIYLKMHGDLYGRYVSHLTTNEIETKQYGRDFIRLLSHLLSEYFIIVVGYGGYDNLITEFFMEEPKDNTPIYWCGINEHAPESPLVKVLKEQNRFNYVSISFDDFFIQLGLSFLGDQELSDINPHFLPTIVQAKSQIGKEQYPPSNDYVFRKDLMDQVDNFFIDANRMTLFLHGKKGMGKSVLVGQMMQYYNDLLFVPVKLNRDITESVLINIAKGIGYKTDVPFSLLYNFAKWSNELQLNIVFTIDEIHISTEQEDSLKYIKELFDFLNIVKQYQTVKFIICIDEASYETVNKILNDSSYQRSFYSSISISKFSNKEVNTLLQKVTPQFPISDEIYSLLRNPYIWQLISKKDYVADCSLNDFMGVYIERLICDKNNNINKMGLQLYLEKRAYHILHHLVKEKKEIFDKHLQDNQILDADGNFVYDKYTEYYYYKYLKRQFTTTESIDFVNIGEMLKNSIIRNAYVRMFSDIDSAEHIRKNIDEINKIVNQINTEDLYLKKFVYDVFKNFFQQKYIHLKNYILNSNLEDNEIPWLLENICYTAIFSPKDPHKILNYISNIKPEMKYDIFLIKNDYMHQHMPLPIHLSEMKTYIDSYQSRFLQQNTKANFIDFIYLLTQWGPDIMNETLYQETITYWQTIIQKQKDQIFSSEAFSYSIQQIKKYAYNILFNSGTDVEEKFVNAINNETLRSTIMTVLSGNPISLQEYLQLASLATDINNAWIFLICNFITIASAQNNLSHTTEVFQNAINNFEQKDLVKILDFYLSSVFMSLNMTQQDNFNLFFDEVVKKYEKVLFETPAVRSATLLRFSDEFEQHFEDGFNPLAFYFYTAPGLCYKEQKSWNNGNEYLCQYWQLAYNLDLTGNCSEMLRIVHALGQMISIYPQEGFAALENLVDYPHEIIKKGIRRILAENYLRYPTQTIDFVNKTKLNISQEELLQISRNNKPKWQNRTLEQLHWYRLFSNLSNILQRDIVKDFLEKITISVSYSSFMNDFFEDLFD
ncbi:MAG: SIR2 family protein [Eubacteriales bacterium]|nr:SIR2 family protein [Eubacteriales bacterium]